MKSEEMVNLTAVECWEVNEVFDSILRSIFSLKDPRQRDHLYRLLDKECDKYAYANLYFRT